MKKFLKWLLIISVGLAVILFVSMRVLRYQTKKHSPEATITYNQGSLDLKVFYCRPYKKGRQIFGELVPYNKVWRTGANEATTFTTKSDIKINGQSLKAGEYTLWSIPGENEWEVFFNSEKHGWGVRMKDGMASRNPEFDVVSCKVPVQIPNDIVDQFTISFQDNGNLNLVLEWDSVRVSLPIQSI